MSKAIKFQIMIGMFVVSFFVLLQGKAKAESCYTDAWADDSEVPAGMFYEDGDVRAGPNMVGVGITEIEYFEEYHDAVAVTTITSPNGRVVSVRDYEHSRYQRTGFSAVAEATLIWNYDDPGNYTIITEHSSTCPFIDFGTTQSDWYLGVSVNTMKFESGGTAPNNPALYFSIPNCNVTCPVYTYTRPNFLGDYVKLYVPRGPFGCLKGSLVVGYANNTPCYDL